MIDRNIKEFLAAARCYLFSLLPAHAPELARIPLKHKH